MAARAAALPGLRSAHSIAVRGIKGVGDAMAARLARLGIHSLQDLWFHLPLRYLDRTHITPWGAEP